MSGLIRRNRAAIDRDLGGGRLRRFVSPVLYAIDHALERHVPRHMRGVVLDAGCGSGPYRRLIESVADRYESLDTHRILDDQTYVGDIQAMSDVPSGRFDGVVCSEVLEHVPRPADALAEIRRVLADDGTVILTVPFLGRLHDEPHDYYRFTRHGLRALLESAAFEDIRIERIGSFFSFFGHQLATLVVGTTWHLPGVRWLAFALNALFVTLPSLLFDRWLGSDRLPLGYAVIARAAPTADAPVAGPESAP